MDWKKFVEGHNCQIRVPRIKSEKRKVVEKALAENSLNFAVAVTPSQLRKIFQLSEQYNICGKKLSEFSELDKQVWYNIVQIAKLC